MAKSSGYMPKKETVSIPRPSGKSSATGSNSPTKTQAHVAVGGKNRVSTPSDTSGARGGSALK